MKDSAPADGPAEAGCNGGFEAAAAMFMASADCTSCVEAQCTASAQACACDPKCIEIIQCQIACVADGGVGEDCAMTCVGKNTDGTAMGQAETFDFACLAPGKPCASVCVTSSKMGDASAD